MEHTIYSGDFFETRSKGSRRSASIVVPIFCSLVGPKSAIDVGCGAGTWAAEFIANGVPDVLGVDGDYVDPAQLQIPKQQFLAHDLVQRLDLNRRFDAAVCLEVCEHLPAVRAQSLIADLTTLAPCVLFSGAVPGQGGQNHINEQYPSYWAALFDKFGYRSLDLIRPKIWNDEGVEWWYRQNVIIFAEANHPLHSIHALEARDIIHPELYDPWTRPTISMLVNAFPGAIRRSFRTRILGKRQ